jgi:hypothetical protein
MTTATLERPVNIAAHRLHVAIERSRIYQSLASAGTAITQDPLTGIPHGPIRSAAGVLVSDLAYRDDTSETGRLLIRLFGAVAGGEGDAAIARVARSLVGLLVAGEADINACALEMGEAVPVRFLAGGAA